MKEIIREREREKNMFTPIITKKRKPKLKKNCLDTNHEILKSKLFKLCIRHGENFSK